MTVKGRLHMSMVTHVFATGILSVRPSVCLFNACMCVNKWTNCLIFDGLVGASF